MKKLLTQIKNAAAVLTAIMLSGSMAGLGVTLVIILVLFGLVIVGFALFADFFRKRSLNLAR